MLIFRVLIFLLGVIDMLCCSVFATGGARGGVFVFVTSQFYGSPDNLFESTVSEFELCAFLQGLSVMILSQFVYIT